MQPTDIDWPWIFLEVRKYSRELAFSYWDGDNTINGKWLVPEIHIDNSFNRQITSFISAVAPWNPDGWRDRLNEEMNYMSSNKNTAIKIRIWNYSVDCRNVEPAWMPRSWRDTVFEEVVCTRKIKDVTVQKKHVRKVFIFSILSKMKIFPANCSIALQRINLTYSQTSAGLLMLICVQTPEISPGIRRSTASYAVRFVFLSTVCL